MPLKGARRLPRKFRRQTTSYMRGMARKNTFASERKRRRRRERVTRMMRRVSQFSAVVASEFRLWAIIGVGIIIITAASVLLFAPFFDVRQIQVRRQDPRIDPEEVQQILSPLFNQRLVLVTGAQVNAMLTSEYPDITKVSIGKDYPSTLIVTVELEPVIAGILIEEDASAPEAGSGVTVAPAATGSVVHSYITERGTYTESQIPLTKGKLSVLRITDWAIRPQNRTLLLRSEFLQTIFRARDTLRRDFGLETSSITVYLRAKEFHLKTNKGTLWFDLKSDLPVQFARFREFLKSITLDSVKEYVDLRIADKVIYR